MEPFIGQIAIFGFNFTPPGWAQCNGQLLSIFENSALFALIGTTYGGDGQTTFALPDLRGRRPIHQGQRPGGATYVIGQAGGSETTAITSSRLPSHTHPAAVAMTIPAAGAIGTSRNPVGNVFAASSGGEGYAAPSKANGTSAPVTVQATVGSTGGNQSVPVINPFQIFNYCIAIDGIFPSQS
jgi:microcystin-dependent protein